MLVVQKVMSGANQGKAGLLSAVVTRRKRFPHDTRNLVFFCVLRIVNHTIDAGLGNLITWLERLCMSHHYL